MPFGWPSAGVGPAQAALYAFLATLSTIVLPVPEEAALLAAGYAARIGRAPLAACFAAAWLAVLIGDCLSYLAGRALLGPLLRTRAGRRIVPEDRLAWAERAVRGQGWRAVALARFFVGLRGFLYFAVGASRYPFGRFVAADAAAAVVEAGSLVSLGFGVGALHARAEGGARTGAVVDLIAAALLLAALAAPAFVKARIGRRPRPG